MVLESLLLSQDADIIRVLRRVLSDLGMQLEVCSGPADASQLLEKRKYDAIIIDCDDVAGAYEVLRNIRKSPSNKSSTAFAIVNGVTSVGAAFEMGANLALEKPLSVDRATRSFRAAQGLMLAERRRYFRHPVDFSVVIVAGEQRINAVANNLSEGGMALTVRQVVPMAGGLKLVFTLPGTGTPLEANATLAWADQSGNAGVKFVNPPLQLRMQLARWFADKPLE